MKNFAALLAAALALAAGGALAADGTMSEGPSWSADACAAGPSSGHPAGVDQDEDGVPDSEDWCVHTPAGVHVGSNGCGKGEVAVSCPRFVSDTARVVPTVAETPSPPPPWEKPAVVDSDGDGVADADDRCPGTPKGADVDRRGCVEIEKVVLKGVNFATGSHTLLPGASDTLKSVVSAMKANPDLQVEVDGYTDNVGNASKNLKLSERRAKSVKNFLVKEGVDAKRLTTKGFGAADPVDTNQTPEGRANNRRVAFKVVKE